MVTETHEQELQELFDKLPVVTFNGEPSLINGEPIKMITYSVLVAVTDAMMAKAYYYGKMNAIQNVEEMMISTFK